MKLNFWPFSRKKKQKPSVVRKTPVSRQSVPPATRNTNSYDDTDMLLNTVVTAAVVSSMSDDGCSDYDTSSSFDRSDSYCESTSDYSSSSDSWGSSDSGSSYDSGSSWD